MADTKTMCRRATAALLALFAGGAHADCLVDGVALNQSYTTLCAEVDNVNVPFIYTNATAYRVTATHPDYFPVALDIRAPDFTNCDFADTRNLWILGTNNGLNDGFAALGSFTNGDTHFAQDNPPEGTDEVWSNSFPALLNNDTINDQYIRFTANEAGDANTELTIGANLKVSMAQVIGTLEVTVRVWNGSGWIGVGSEAFTSVRRTNVWAIPDFTWLPGTDANILHLDVVTFAEGGASTLGATARYDYVELRKRDETGNSTSLLYDDGKVKVESVFIDFWWRAPQAMTVAVVGGLTNTSAHYLRITRKEPTGTGYNEIFVLYEDGNARIIPFPPVGLSSVPYGASVLLGPSQDSARPYSAIDALIVDPIDLALDIQYESGDSAHVELYTDRDQHVVDVDGITYNTATQSFARLRSMWAFDGKADIDRIWSEEGPFPVLGAWTALHGTWWQFHREVPTYHNTYCPEFRVEVIGPSQAFLTRQAESHDAGSNVGVVTRSGAVGGSSLAFSNSGGSASYIFTLTDQAPEAALLIRYADANGGDNGTNLGNRLDIHLNGAWTSRTWSANTGGSNSFERTPLLFLGNLLPGTHTVRVTAASGTGGVEIDELEFIAQPESRWSTNSIVTRQAEHRDSGTGVSTTNRASASGGTSLVMSVTGGSASYAVTVPSATTGLYMRVRHADAWNPTKLEVFLDGNLRARMPSATEGDIYVNNANLDAGPGAGGTPDSWFDCCDVGQETWAAESGTYGMAFYGWVVNGAGYFGTEVSVDSRFGNVFSFMIRGNREANFVSTSGTMRLKLEFWVRGEGAARRVVTNNVHALFMATTNQWTLARVSGTNTDSDVNMVKVVVDFADAAGVGASGLAMKWDNAQVFQGYGTGADYFEDAGILYLGDVASGVHTVTLVAANETLGMEIDEIELFTLERSNRAPGLGVPATVIVPVGSPTNFVLLTYEDDPDCLQLGSTNLPSGSSLTGSTFSWTPPADRAGTTGVVTFLADDQRQAGNSVYTTNVVLIVPFDSDTNGLGDGWEWTWFTNLGVSGSADPDTDRVNNHDEFIAGTVPGDPASYFHVTNVTGSAMRYIHIQTQPGRKYTIQYVDGTLTNDVTWSNFGSTNAGIGYWLETNAAASAFTFVDDGTPASTGGQPADGLRHYRVRVELQ